MSPEARQVLLDLSVQLAGFLIAFGILKRLFWRPILGALDERREKIASEFESIEKAKQEMAQLKAEYQERLGRIEEEARGKIQQAVAEGRRVASEIEEGARAHSRESLDKTKELIALEVAKAREELREQVVDLAIQATHKILERHLDEETDRRMIEAFIKEVNEMEGK